MAPTFVARVGRHRQLYDEQSRRLVAGCIPYRSIENCSGDLEDRFEVLMITSNDRDDYVFPKGGWENDETSEEAAQREALEEAGVRGIIRALVGTWELQSKSAQKTHGRKGTCVGSIFAMEVTQELENWPEMNIYQRRWVTVREASRLCRYTWMIEALDKWLGILPGVASSPVPEPSEALSYIYVQPPLSEHIANPVNAFCW